MPLPRLCAAALALACAPPAGGRADAAAADAPPAGADAGADAAACAPPAGARARDALGGDARVTLAATGRFALARLCGRDWLVTPDGHPFYSVGVNHATPDGDVGRETGRAPYAEATAARYPTREAWADAAAERLRSWGLTTAGSWSSADLFAGRLPFTVNLALAGADWQTGRVADYFDPAWRAEVEARVAERATPWRAAAGLVGYFLDNEVHWGPDWRGADTLLQTYLALPAAAAGKQEAVALLLAELGSVAAVGALLGVELADEAALLAATDAWDALDAGASETAERLTRAFVARAAQAYFRATVEALRAVDPAHLVLGNREVSYTVPPEVVEAAAEWVDVLSLNHYVFLDGVGAAALALSGALDPAEFFVALHARVARPILVTEFGFRAADSGLPNSWPPVYPTYASQAERADAFEAYARAAQETPWIVGYHWFEWADQPAEGRFDGEDNNWGLVDAADEPYAAVTERMAEVNPAIADHLVVEAR